MKLRAGIIAAGDGLRLKESHPHLIKPMVPVAGAPLCHWAVSALKAGGARELTVLLNSAGAPARQSLKAAFPDLAWTFLVKDTASSWESFRLVAQALSRGAAPYGKGRGDFLISTVDALVPPGEIRRFVEQSRRAQARAALALTSFVDDEKPLWADVDDRGRIVALGERARGKTYATAGLYYLTPDVAAAMPESGAHPRLRSYLGALLSGGVPLLGVPLSKTLDVDRPQDLRAAEEFVTWSPA